MPAQNKSAYSIYHGVLYKVKPVLQASKLSSFYSSFSSYFSWKGNSLIYKMDILFAVFEDL